MAQTIRQSAPVSGAPRGRGRRRAVLACSDPALRAAAAAAITRAGVEVEAVASAAAARERLATGCPDYLICDLALDAVAEGGRKARRGAGPPADAGAPALCRAFREGCGEDEFAYVLILAPPGQEARLQAALAAGADDFVTLPLAQLEMATRLAAGLRFLEMADRLRAGRAEAARALEELRRSQAATEADLAEARRLQQGLVGERQARFGAFDLSLLMRPAGHVGGDLVGFFPINARRVALYALDVCGKGIAAALLTARLAAHLNGFAGENIALCMNADDLYDARPPVEVIRRLNRLMLEDMVTDAYFTMIYIDLDVQSGAARMVQAGHPHPLLQAADGTARRLGEGGLPIGLIEEADWEEVAFELAPGERLFVASDGITEAMDPAGRLLGEEGLVAILRTNAFLAGAPMLESLCWSLSQYTGGQRSDDISAILVERDRPLGEG